MKHVRSGVLLAAGLAVCLGVSRPALAQSPPAPQTAPLPPSPASSSAISSDVQQVRDELARLQKEFEVMRQEYNERLIALERRLSQIGGGPSVMAPESPTSPKSPESPTSPTNPESPKGPDGPAPAAPPAAAGQNMAGASKVFNPDSSVIANFIGAGGKNPFNPQPALELSEAEVAFQAVVDPYSRADFFLSAGPEGLSVEEGYLTFTGLPGNLLLKVGKMRASFGKVNTMHTHVLPWTDRPLVTQNLVGGEDGISESGLSVSRLLQNPFMFLELTGETFYGSSGVFESNKRSALVYTGRVRAYRDLTEGTNLDLGGSFAYGPSAVVPDMVSPLDTSTRLFGFDATLRYRPLRRAIYRRFIARSEFVWSQSRESGVAGQTAFGMYGSGDYQFARRWYAGARYDRSGRTWEPSTTDTGGAFYLTYWPSEFNQVRGEYRRINYGDGVDANEFLFQFLFSIGAHGAHVF